MAMYSVCPIGVRGWLVADGPMHLKDTKVSGIYPNEDAAREAARRFKATAERINVLGRTLPKQRDSYRVGDLAE